MTNLWGSITSGLADTLGKIGGELAPTFDSVRETFTSWFKDNQGGFVSTITEWVKPENMKKCGMASSILEKVASNSGRLYGLS